MTRYRRVGGSSQSSPKRETPQVRIVFVKVPLATVERPDGTTVQVDEYRALIVNNAVVSVVGTKSSAQADVQALVDSWDEPMLEQVAAFLAANGDADLTNEVDSYFTSPKMEPWFDTHVVEVRAAIYAANKPTS